jgi:uncharacterized membrane protein
MNKTDVVSEYLHEVEARLGGLPLLQRRELLADLAAHIATERAERDIRSEGEVLEILERLGSPEVVAAAAYEEAGTPTPVRVPATTFVQRRGTPSWVRVVVIAAIALVLVLCLGTALLVLGARTGGDARPVPEPVRPAVPGPVASR